MNFKELLAKNEFVLLDGAMGTMLQIHGLNPQELPEITGIQNPDLVTEIHRKYIKAGAQIIYSNTFGANRYKMDRTKFSVKEVISAAVSNAKRAAEGTDAVVALDIGPIGQMIEPSGSLKFEEAYELYKEEVISGADADLIIIETMTDLYDMKAALLAAKENSELPVLCSMTFEKNLRTFTGCPISAMVLMAENLGADAIGLNCSLGPVDLIPHVKEIMKWTTLPVLVKPNAGLPDPVTGAYSITPAEFALSMKELASLGVKILGGCCGTNPEFIHALKEILVKEDFHEIRACSVNAVCSASKTILIETMLPEVQSLNPADEHELMTALIEDDTDVIIDLAIEKAEEGAELIAVNAASFKEDEEKFLVKMIKAIQSGINTPLIIEASSPAALEKALRAYNGRPAVRMLSSDHEYLQSVLPVIKKYGPFVLK